MASSHRRYAGWTIERIRKDAASIGPGRVLLCPGAVQVPTRVQPQDTMRGRALSAFARARPRGSDRQLRVPTKQRRPERKFSLQRRRHFRGRVLKSRQLCLRQDNYTGMTRWVRLRSPMGGAPMLPT